MTDLSKDFRTLYLFYVNELIDRITDEYHVPKHDLHDIWKQIEKPQRKARLVKKTQPLTVKEKKLEQLWHTLHALKIEDLYRHCQKNGIQPPNNKEDMIKAIMTKLSV